MRGEREQRDAFAAELRQLRAAAGLSHADLAQHAHVNHGYLGHVEHGQRWPSRPVTAALDRALAADDRLLAAWAAADAATPPVRQPEPAEDVLSLPLDEWTRLDAAQLADRLAGGETTLTPAAGSCTSACRRHPANRRDHRRASHRRGMVEIVKRCATVPWPGPATGVTAHRYLPLTIAVLNLLKSGWRCGTGHAIILPKLLQGSLAGHSQAHFGAGSPVLKAPNALTVAPEAPGFDLVDLPVLGASCSWASARCERWAPRIGVLRHQRLAAVLGDDVVLGCGAAGK